MGQKLSELKQTKKVKVVFPRRTVLIVVLFRQEGIPLVIN